MCMLLIRCTSNSTPTYSSTINNAVGFEFKMRKAIFFDFLLVLFIVLLSCFSLITLLATSS